MVRTFILRGESDQVLSAIE